MYHEPYVEMLLESVKTRKQEKQKYPSVDESYRDFKSGLGDAEKAISKGPMKHEDVEVFIDNLRQAERSLNSLIELGREHLTAEEAQSLYQTLRPELTRLVERFSEKVERLSKSAYPEGVK